MHGLLQDVEAMRAAVGVTGRGGACAFRRRQGDQGEAIRARRRAVIRRDSMLADGLRAVHAGA